MVEQLLGELGVDLRARRQVAGELRRPGEPQVLSCASVGDPGVIHRLTVLAVADTVAVLRLGKNNGSFPVKTTSHEEIIAAITGATDNAVTRRAGRRSTEAAK